jgi:CBS-domain-containing membrane protein
MSELRHLPIWSRSTLKGDGSREVWLRVFCPARSESTPFAVCARCPRCHALTEPAILCRLPPAPEVPDRMDVAEAAARTRIADLLPSRVECTLPETPMDLVRRLGPEVVPVVEDDGELVGIIDTRRAHDGPLARDAMDPPLQALNEDAAVASAIAAFAITKAPALPVVAADGALVGLLSSSEVLRWLARTLGYK